MLNEGSVLTHRPFFIGPASTLSAIMLAIISFLSGLGWMLDRKKHRQEVEALRADCNGKDLPPKVASTGCTSAMSELAAFGLHSTCLPEEVSGPFWWGEGFIVSAKADDRLMPPLRTTHFVRAVHGFLPV